MLYPRNILNKHTLTWLWLALMIVLVATQRILYDNNVRMASLDGTDNKKGQRIVADLFKVFQKYECCDIYETYSGNQSRGFR